MVSFLYEEKRVTAGISGEIDHHNSALMRRKIDMELKEKLPSEVVFDFEKVTFMDSSGIGLIIGRYKLMNNIGGKVIVKNASDQIKKVMKLSGIDKIARII